MLSKSHVVALGSKKTPFARFRTDLLPKDLFLFELCCIVSHSVTKVLIFSLMTREEFIATALTLKQLKLSLLPRL